MTELMGKLLMIDDDMQMSSLEKTGILKQLITADGMKVRGYRGVYIKVRDSENPFLKAS